MSTLILTQMHAILSFRAYVGTILILFDICRYIETQVRQAEASSTMKKFYE